MSSTSTRSPIRSSARCAVSSSTRSVIRRTRASISAWSSLPGRPHRLGALLVGVAEDPDGVQAALGEEALELGDVVLGLAGEAEDDVGAEAGVRRERTGALDQRPGSRRCRRTGASGAAGSASECWKDRSKYGATRSVPGDDLEQARPQLGRLQVGDPHAGDALDRGELGQQLLQRAQVAEVLAVGRRVLADQHQLGDALRGQPLRLAEHLGRRAGRRRRRGRSGWRRTRSGGRSPTPASARRSGRRPAACGAASRGPGMAGASAAAGGGGALRPG